MSNEQLWLAIGAPLLFNGIIFVLIATNFNARFASIDARFASIDARFAGIEGRLASLEQRMDLIVGAIHDLDNRLSRLAERLEHR